MRLSIRIFYICLAVLSGCAENTQQDISGRYTELSTSSLWLVQQTVSSPRDLAFIEAELGLRGETRAGFAYLGRRTFSAFGNILYSRSTQSFGISTASSGKKNCADFSTAAHAQQFFLKSGGPALDPNDLDRDGDGLACEWGTKIQSIMSGARTSTITNRQRNYNRCFVGPRGGTYTISASGAKNYNGC